jgi:hypothetical protein
MDLLYCFSFARGIEDGWPGCGVYFGEEGLKVFRGTWTGVETCSGCDGTIPFGDAWKRDWNVESSS